MQDHIPFVDPLHVTAEPMKGSSLARTGPLKRKPGQVRKKTTPHRRGQGVPGLSAAALAFRLGVMEDASACLMCGAEHGIWEAHHAVEAQTIWRICRSARMTDSATLARAYDPRIGVPLCAAIGTPNRCHGRQTLGFDRVEGGKLPERVITAAIELGPEALAALDREHPGAADFWGYWS